jgi:hypothetical protein
MFNNKKNNIILFGSLFTILVVIGLILFANTTNNSNLTTLSLSFKNIVKPTQVINKETVSLAINKVVDGQNLFINGEKVENDIVKLKAGDNIFKIVVKDEKGNSSKEEVVTINNLVSKDIIKNNCEDLNFNFSKSRWQIGYSGVINGEIYEKDEYFIDQKTFKCDPVFRPYESFYGQGLASFYPIGSKASCWACDGGTPPMEYINVSRINGKSLQANPTSVKPFLSEKEKYSLFSGRNGITYVVKEKQQSNGKTRYTANFVWKEKDYIITSVITKISDFTDFLNMIELPDNQLEYVSSISDKEGRFNSKSGLSFNYTKSWTITDVGPTKTSFQSVDIDGKPKLFESVDPSVVMLKKGIYSLIINVDKLDKNIGGITSDLFKAEDYSTFTVDGIAFEMPVLSKKMVKLPGENQSPYAYYGTYNGIIQKNDTGYSYGIKTKSNVILIEFQVDFASLVDKITLTDIDKKVEQEVYEIIRSIKWNK